MMGLHDEIKLSFMIVGHTKFGPDRYFGLIRRLYRKSKIYTYNQLVDLIQNSSKNGQNLCQPFRHYNSEPNYQYYKWDSWLSKYFKKLPEITKYQNESFHQDKPFDIIVKESIDGSEHTFNLLKNKEYRFDGVVEKPSILIPNGLSVERQWYLYENIRKHIPNIEDQDETCPLPRENKNVK